MATKNMAYDHPAYVTPVIYSGMSTAGANGVTTKWAAYTAQKIMSVTYTQVVLSTAAGSQPLLYYKTGTNTGTSTLTVLSSGSATAINLAIATPISLIQGDWFYFTHGTDGTATVAVAVETNVIPGSNITAPT
jgi:hypothetical protein